MKNTKNYTEFHIVKYKGKNYIFDPYRFGRGLWAILTPTGKPGKNVDRGLQRELNVFYFQQEELPSIQERFKTATAEEIQKLKDISITWLQLKIKALQQGIEIPQLVPPDYKSESGGLYLYVYDAKYKDILPIWDKFPLTIILELTNVGFLGLNLHYLDGALRLIFIDQLIRDFGNTYNKMSNMLKLAISYDLIKNKDNNKSYKPCIRRYLFSHIVNNKILPIQSHEWLYAAMVSVPQFQKLNNKSKR